MILIGLVPGSPGWICYKNSGTCIRLRQGPVPAGRFTNWSILVVAVMSQWVNAPLVLIIGPRYKEMMAIAYGYGISKVLFCNCILQL